MGESTHYPINHLINNWEGEKPTGAVWGGRPQTAPRKVPRPRGGARGRDGLGYSQRAYKATQRHGGKMSDYALWQ